MSEFVEIDRSSRLPLYLQVTNQIRRQISIGQLPLGTRLPTIRQLAKMLGVTRSTVSSAYNELQADGWIESTVGRGTYVIAPPQSSELIEALETGTSAGSMMYNLHNLDQLAAIESFAYAVPDPNLFPEEDFWDVLMTLRRSRRSVFNYGSPQGEPELRVQIAALIEELGLYFSPDNIIVTSGTNQGLSILSSLLAQPGDTIIASHPTYFQVHNIAETSRLKVVGVPIDEDGPLLDVFEEYVRQHRPKFFYTAPNYENPTGVCMSLERRERILELAEEYNFYIVEDDCYAFLAYDVLTPPSFKAMDEADRVIYLSSFSKIMMPGLRVGYLIAPPHLQSAVAKTRQSFDLCGSPLVELAIAEFIRRGRLKSHRRKVLPIYRERRDIFVREMRFQLPPDVEWTYPVGGFSSWITLPEDAPPDFYRMAICSGLALTPGQAFIAEKSDRQHLRMCFSARLPEDIRRGVRMLADLLSHRDVLQFDIPRQMPVSLQWFDRC